MVTVFDVIWHSTAFPHQIFKLTFQEKTFLTADSEGI